jgi:aspartyl-tRNA(Asn)/glutamyl-tRNA(Gln) amidotransferase subunit B
MSYKMVIGLEVHVQMNTKTKIFCSCSTQFTNKPNSHTCPVCQGHPGVLPVLNKGAVKKALYAALATGCRINERSLFDRKSYSYPDLPKGYQITQFYSPICEGGFIEIQKADGSEKKIRINHIHIEEDAGKLVHGEGAQNESYVDLNRAGVPLLEIVSEADINSTEEAVLYATKLRQVLMYAGVTDGNMQEGSVRFDVNLSLMKESDKEWGTRTETKNLNSFTALKKAIEMEYERQSTLLDNGQKVLMETRLFNLDKMESRSLRVKGDGEQGYLYFRDPDIPVLVVDKQMIKEVESSLPLLPSAYIQKYVDELGLKREDALILIQEKANVDFFEKAIEGYEKYTQRIANFFLSDLIRVLKDKKMEIEDIKLEPKELGVIFELIDTGEISLKIAKDLIDDMISENKGIKTLIKERGLTQISNEAELETLIKGILAKNEANVTAYKNGKTQVMGFFVGQVMKESGGKANPAMVNALLKKLLES